MEKPAMSDDLTAPAASEPEAEGSAPKANETKAEETKKPEEKRDDKELPADHPLVKAYNAQKATLKELKVKADRFDEIEEAAKTELQRAQERADSAEGALSAIKAAQVIQDIKSQISKRYKDEGYDIPASALRGSDEEELEEHALELKALLPPPPKPGSVPAEGRNVTTGNGDPRTVFARLLRD